MFTALLTLIGFMLLAGATLLAVGLRGPRINDHPVCRGCRFDLSGSPQPLGLCPECGADLSQPSRVRTGQRRRRPGLAGIGAVTAALAILAGAGIGWGIAKGTNWNAHKPVALLLFEARAGTAEEAEAAISELMDRRIAGNLRDRASMQQFVETILERQADERMPWGGAWEDALALAAEEGLLGEAELESVKRHALSLEVEFEPMLSEGDTFLLWMNLESWRGWSVLPPYLLFEGHRAIINGREFEAPFHRSLTNNRYKFSMPLPMGGAGRNELVVEWRYAFVEDWRQPPEASQWLPLQRSGTYEVFARAGREHIKLIPDEGKREELQSSIRAYDASATPIDDKAILQFYLSIESPPVNVAFEVFVRQGDSEWKAGLLVGLAHLQSSTSAGTTIVGLQPGPVDVVLRASKEALRPVTVIDDAWDGEIVIENLPVVWYGSLSTPADPK